jgi:hypothetical protein
MMLAWLANNMQVTKGQHWDQLDNSYDERLVHRLVCSGTEAGELLLSKEEPLMLGEEPLLLDAYLHG